MKEFKTIEFYLYNYKNLDKMMEDLKKDCNKFLESRNTEELKGYFNDKALLENRVVQIMTEKTIENYKLWQAFLTDMLVFLYDNYREFYEFIVSKYFEKKTFNEIEKDTNISVAELRKGRRLLIFFIWAAANDENLIGKEE